MMKKSGCGSNLKSVRRIIWALLLFCFLGFSALFSQECTDSDVQKGVELWDQGKFNMAIKALNDAINRFQKDPKSQLATKCLEKARFYGGLAYFSLGNRNEAGHYFKNVQCQKLSDEDYSPELISFFNPRCKELLKGRIGVSSVPDSANIYLDGKLLAEKTPYVIEDLPVGEHDLRILKEGFKEWTKKVSVTANKTQNENARLVSIVPPKDEPSGPIAPTGPPVEGFIDNNDGTVTDKATKRMWLKDANRPARAMDWDAASKYCEGLDYAGHKDWRLPSRDELTGLARNTISKGKHPFRNVVVHDPYWTSSVVLTGSTCWVVNAATGDRRSAKLPTDNWVWPVRRLTPAEEKAVGLTK